MGVKAAWTLQQCGRYSSVDVKAVWTLRHRNLVDCVPVTELLPNLKRGCYAFPKDDSAAPILAFAMVSRSTERSQAFRPEPKCSDARLVGDVKATEIHDFCPGGYKVMDKFLFGVVTSVDFRDSAQLRV